MYDTQDSSWKENAECSWSTRNKSSSESVWTCASLIKHWSMTLHVFESIICSDDITGHMIRLTCYLTHTLLIHSVQNLLFIKYQSKSTVQCGLMSFLFPLFLLNCIWKPADLIFLLSAAAVLIDPVHLTALTHLKVQDLVWTQVQSSRILHQKQLFL